MGDWYGRSDIDEISMGISIWDIDYRHRIWYIDMLIYHIDMVTLDMYMGYGLMIWEMTDSIWSSSISIWVILSLCLSGPTRRWRSISRSCLSPPRVTWPGQGVY